MDHSPKLSSQNRTRIEAAAPKLGADSIALWLIHPTEAKLICLFSPSIDGLEGLAQPLNTGLISQVFLTGLPLLEPSVKNRSAHDSSIDGTTGLITRSMIASPVTINGEIQGVLSAVQFDSRNARAAFQSCDLEMLADLAAKFTENLSHGL